MRGDSPTEGWLDPLLTEVAEDAVRAQSERVLALCEQIEEQVAALDQEMALLRSLREAAGYERQGDSPTEG